MSLHVPIQMDQASPYSALSAFHLSPVGGSPRHIPILLYKHASKWNSTMYKHPEPFSVAFDTHGTLPGYGVHHGELVSHSAAMMSSSIVCGGELVNFPTQCRKIQFRIVVRCTRPLRTTGGQLPDTYILSCCSGPVMTPSTFPRRSIFRESPSANWQEALHHSTPSSSRFVPCLYLLPSLLFNLVALPPGGTSTQVHREWLCSDPRDARDPPYRRYHQ